MTDKTIPMASDMRKKVLEQVQKQTADSTTPTMSFIGCGGAGLNIGKKLIGLKGLTLAGFDTSLSNIDAIKFPIEVIEKPKSGAHGSGQIRGHVANEIQQQIPESTIIRSLGDIVIVCHSFSGASGAVIGHFLCKLLAQEKRAFIIIGITDSASENYTNNSINAIGTYNNFASSESLYFPVKLFSNSTSRNSVDSAIVQFVTDFVDMLTNQSITERDVNDKKNWLRPSITHGLSGVYEINVYNDGSYVDSMEPVHSVYTVNDSGDTAHMKIPDAKIVYSGKSESCSYVGVIGSRLNADIINELEHRADKFHTINDSTSGLDDLGKNKVRGSRSASGVIL